jgi:hypothetical protein
MEKECFDCEYWVCSDTDIDMGICAKHTKTDGTPVFRRIDSSICDDFETRSY